MDNKIISQDFNLNGVYFDSAQELFDKLPPTYYDRLLVDRLYYTKDMKGDQLRVSLILTTQTATGLVFWKLGGEGVGNWVVTGLDPTHLRDVPDEFQDLNPREPIPLDLIDWLTDKKLPLTNECQDFVNPEHHGPVVAYTKSQGGLGGISVFFPYKGRHEMTQTLYQTGDISNVVSHRWADLWGVDTMLFGGTGALTTSGHFRRTI